MPRLKSLAMNQNLLIFLSNFPINKWWYSIPINMNKFSKNASKLTIEHILKLIIDNSGLFIVVLKNTSDL